MFGGVKKVFWDKVIGEKYFGMCVGKYCWEIGDEVIDLRWLMGVFWGVYMYF